MRLPRKQSRASRAAYEFFAGTNAAGNADLDQGPPSQREPVMEKPNVLDAPPTVAWNPYLSASSWSWGT